MEKQRAYNSQHNIEENKVRVLTLLDFKTYNKATEDNVVLTKESKNKSVEQNSEPRNGSTNCGQLISTKVQEQFNEKRYTFNK